MDKTDILELIKVQGNKVDQIVLEIEKDLDLLPAVYEGMKSSNKRIKNGSAKIFNIISQKHPERLYPQFDFFVDLLDLDDNIIKWNTIIVLGNMVVIDKNNKISTIIKKIYQLSSDESMITASHAVVCLGKIAKSKPAYKPEILKQFVKVEKEKRNAECKDILLGKVILSLGIFFDKSDYTSEIIDLVHRQLSNSRNATKVKAEKFLGKLIS